MKDTPKEDASTRQAPVIEGISVINEGMDVYQIMAWRIPWCRLSDV